MFRAGETYHVLRKQNISRAFGAYHVAQQHIIFRFTENKTPERGLRRWGSFAYLLNSFLNRSIMALKKFSSISFREENWVSVTLFTAT